MEVYMKNLNIGDTILRCRKEKGITQEQLSNMVGVSAGAVCKWETGTHFQILNYFHRLHVH